MEKYIIQEELKNCPGITYYPASNKLEMVGRSIPENPELVYSRLDEWLTIHFKKNNGLNIFFKLEYINSGSSKYLHDILKKLTDFKKNGMLVSMKWLCEADDENILELGEHYRDNVKIPLDIEIIK